MCSASCRRVERKRFVNLILIIVLVLLLCGGGLGYRAGWAPAAYGGMGVLSVVLLVVVLVLLFGAVR
jgi:uncharacterized membrane protein